MSKATVIPFGPQHPVLPEPLHLDLVVQDETVVDVLPQIGFVHRGLEKLVETRDYNQFIYIAERICGICAMGHSLGYAETVESLMGVEVPKRAEYLRVIWHELSRIHSHLLWLGLAADAFGFESMFMHCWRLRERVLDLFEKTTGGRVILSVVKVGGVVRDIDASQMAEIVSVLDGIKGEYTQIMNTLLTDTSVKNRTVGVAVGTFAAGFLRFMCSFLSGVLVWGNLNDGLAAWTYSLTYNGSYMLPETLLTMVAAVLLCRVAPQIFDRQAR